VQRTALTWFCLASLVLSCAAAAQESVSPPVAGLLAETREQRDAAAAQILSDRKQLVDALIPLVTKKLEPHPRRRDNFFQVLPEHDAKYLAIVILGEMRAVEAIPALLDAADFHHPRFFSGSYRSRGGIYPALEGLRKIGLPAVPALLAHIARQSDDGVVMQNCCWALYWILGGDGIQNALREAAEQADSEGARRLQPSDGIGAGRCGHPGTDHSQALSGKRACLSMLIAETTQPAHPPISR
jgi:hypothetical protein